MDNQAIVNDLEALLRRAKEKPCLGAPPAAGGHGEKCSGGCNGTGTITDPRLQAAWEEVLWAQQATLLILSHYTRPIPDWFWRGLLEQVVETAKLGELQHYPGQPRRFIRINHNDGGRHTTFYENAQQLGEAIMEALALAFEAAVKGIEVK